MSKFRKKIIYEHLILGKNAPILHFLVIVYAYGVSVTHIVHRIVSKITPLAENGVTYYKFFFRVPTDSI